MDSTGNGGTSTTGNTVRKILRDNELRSIFTSGITNSSDRAVAETFGSMLSKILRIMSSRYAINIPKYKNLCKSLYIYLLTELPWVSITPTLHKLLAHSSELIEANDGKGLCKLSEEGLETCHKRLREIRLKLSRKCSQKKNLTDCLNRLWIGSGLYIKYFKLSIANINKTLYAAII